VLGIALRGMQPSLLLLLLLRGACHLPLGKQLEA
jgi:hypothetical protein